MTLTLRTYKGYDKQPYCNAWVILYFKDILLNVLVYEFLFISQVVVMTNKIMNKLYVHWTKSKSSNCGIICVQFRCTKEFPNLQGKSLSLTIYY